MTKLAQELSASRQRIKDIEKRYGIRVSNEEENDDDDLRPIPDSLYDLYARQEEFERRILLRELSNSDSVRWRTFMNVHFCARPGQPMDRLEAEKYNWITHKLAAAASETAHSLNDKWLDEQIEELKRANYECDGEKEKIELRRLHKLAQEQRNTIVQRRETIHGRREMDDIRTDHLKTVMYPNQFEEFVIRARAEQLLLTSQGSLINNYLHSRKGVELDLPIADPIVEPSDKKERRKKAEAERERVEDGAVGDEEWEKYDPANVNQMTRRDREMLGNLNREKDEWVHLALQQWEEAEEGASNGDQDGDVSEEEIICDDSPLGVEAVADNEATAGVLQASTSDRVDEHV